MNDYFYSTTAGTDAWVWTSYRRQPPVQFKQPHIYVAAPESPKEPTELEMLDREIDRVRQAAFA